MRLVFRIIGTWLVGLAVVLLVIDGTKSLAANALVMTPLVETWQALNPQGLAAVSEFLLTRFFNALLTPGFEALLSFPTFAIIGVPGIIFALLGRSRYVNTYVRQDSF